MSANPEDLPPTPAELAAFVREQLETATLAEKAGITERTVQRAENGEPSDLTTRRNLARAFGREDIDVFNKPCIALNVEKLKDDLAELEKTTVAYPITQIEDARTLRTVLEGCHTSERKKLAGFRTARAKRSRP